jgi:hypothetical protein
MKWKRREVEEEAEAILESIETEEILKVNRKNQK